MAAITETTRRLVDAIAAGRRDDALAVLSEDFVVADRRPMATLGQRAGREEYVDRMLVLDDLTDGLHGTIDAVEELDDRLHVVFAWQGRLREGGGPFETVFRTVAAVAPDGRFTQVQLFDLEDVAGAEAAMRELSGSDATGERQHR